MGVRVWLVVLWSAAPAGAIDEAGPERAGEAVTVHLPEPQHLRNRGGSDGVGLCVFASIAHAGLYQNEPLAASLFEYMTTRPGGGYPEKVTDVFRSAARDKGEAAPGYVQHTGGDEAFLRLALRTGRYPCVTYSGADGVFYRSRVAHMVNLVRLDATWAVIHDNNYPGRYLWMEPAEFLARWRDMGGGWAVVLLRSPPPPVPTSDSSPAAEKCDTPLSAVAKADGGPNFGIVEDRIPREVRYEVNGVEWPRRRVFEAFGSPLSDDRDRLFVTAVGDAAMRDRVKRDFDGELEEWQSRVHLNAYAPDHWMVRAIGLRPGVTVQGAARSDGRSVVLARLRKYEAGDAPALAGALRRADPNYRPDLDPEQGAPPAVPAEREWVLLAAAVVGVSFRDWLMSLPSRLFRRRPKIDAAELEAFRRWKTRA